jgi:hypothetical protein
MSETAVRLTRRGKLAAVVLAVNELPKFKDNPNIECLLLGNKIVVRKNKK